MIYEISSLANGHLHPTQKTGIFRTVEHLARDLAKSPECSLQFCVSQGLVFQDAAISYLRKSADFAPAQMPHSKRRYIARRMISRVYRNVEESRGLQRQMWRVLKRLVRSWTHSAYLVHYEAVSPVSAKWANIFHAPYRGIPPQVRNYPHLACFTTVYDLVPILFPEHYGFKKPQDHFLTESIDAITRDDWTICISEHTKRDLCAYRADLDPSRMIVIPLAASELFYPCRESEVIEDVRRRYKIPAGPYLLSLSTLEPRKNLPHLIRCFRDLVVQGQVPDLNLVLAGGLGWEYDNILSEIAGVDPKIRSRIVMTGRVADPDLAAIYSDAMAFVFPSLYEGFGLPPLEAMQCGTPVISSNSSSLPEVVGEAGVLVPPTDSEALSQAIIRLHASPELRRDLSQRGEARARLFSWDRCCQETLAAYRLALQEAKK